MPVFVWIHGGGYLVGTGSFQAAKPNLFMDHGIVVVTINYRVGAFGNFFIFLHVKSLCLSFYTMIWV